MTRRGRLAVAVVVLVLGAFALWTADDARRSAPGGVAPTPPPRADVPPRADGRAARDVGVPPASPGPGSRRLGAVLDRHIAAAGLAGRITEERRASLLAALVEVRRSSRRARRRIRDDPDAERAHTETVVAADRLFRETLGVGIAAFVAQQGPPGRVEDLGGERAGR